MLEGWDSYFRPRRGGPLWPPEDRHGKGQARGPAPTCGLISRLLLVSEGPCERGIIKTFFAI
jgi:hypothetical protein